MFSRPDRGFWAHISLSPRQKALGYSASGERVFMVSADRVPGVGRAGGNSRMRSAYAPLLQTGHGLGEKPRLWLCIPVSDRCIVLRGAQRSEQERGTMPVSFAAPGWPESRNDGCAQNPAGRMWSRKRRMNSTASSVHDLGLVPVRVILPLEAHAAIFHRQQSPIGNGYTMGVSSGPGTSGRPGPVRRRVAIWP